MCLGEFVKKFIAPNSIIRLWKKCDNNRNYKMLTPTRPDGVIMSWEINKDDSIASKYANNEVEYIKDILNETYFESINIVIKCE